MIVTDAEHIKMMELEDLWKNYLNSMDMVVNCAKANNREGAVFFAAVVKVTLDTYFDEIEAELCRKGYY